MKKTGVDVALPPGLNCRHTVNNLTFLNCSWIFLEKLDFEDNVLDLFLIFWLLLKINYFNFMGFFGFQYIIKIKTFLSISLENSFLIIRFNHANFFSLLAEFVLYYCLCIVKKKLA